MGPSLALTHSPFQPQDPSRCANLGLHDKVVSVSKKVHVWEKELQNDPDSTFILESIRNGFRLIDPNSCVKPAETDNHKSALLHKEKVEKELLHQIEQGNYIVASDKPVIISPLAAILKDNGQDIRLIHDGSVPVGSSMNDYTTLHSERFQTIGDACKIAKKDYWCAKLDLKAAYRSVPIHCNDYKVTGLKWQFKGEKEITYLFDSRLPFGASSAPSHFHRLSQAIARCMRRRGFSGIVAYIDDFLIAARTYKECNEALHCLIKLVGQLGFCVSWGKVEGPTQQITFLGISIDTRECSLSLDDDKLQRLKSELHMFINKKRATKRQLQRLAGLLNWACQCVRGGKFFMRRILDTIRPLKQQYHKARLSGEFYKDVKWWLGYLGTFNGQIYYEEGPVHHVHVDACNVASGMFWAGDWNYAVFQHDLPLASKLHINYKEVCAAVQSVERWAEHWRDSQVVFHTDNMTAKAVLNKGRSKNVFINKCLRRMFWLSVQYNFTVRAIYVPGQINMIPDTISRLHEKGKCKMLFELLANWSHSFVCYPLNWSGHMSTLAYEFLLQFPGETSRVN